MRENTEKFCNILKKIGQGVLSDVFLGVHRETSEMCAMKVYCKSDLTSSSLRCSINLEIFVLKKLKHPNLLKFLSSHEDDSYVFVMTSFCSQGTLNDRLRLTGSIMEIAALKVIKRLLGVVQFLHENGIAHRDIRPENIFFNGRGALKLANFGLAHIQAIGSERRSRIFCGMKPYAAPEIVSKKPYNPARADIWSVGAVLYYMFTKRHLFYDSAGSVRSDYGDARQEDVCSEMLDPGIVKRSELSQNILLGLLQVEPTKRTPPKTVMSLCDEAIRQLVVLGSMKKIENASSGASTCDDLPDDIVVPRILRRSDYGRLVKTPSKF